MAVAHLNEFQCVDVVDKAACKTELHQPSPGESWGKFGRQLAWCSCLVQHWQPPSTGRWRSDAVSCSSQPCTTRGPQHESVHLLGASCSQARTAWILGRQAEDGDFGPHKEGTLCVVDNEKPSFCPNRSHSSDLIFPNDHSWFSQHWQIQVQCLCLLSIQGIPSP